jgi:hypothetical protein
MQHSAHIKPGRDGLFDLVKTLPTELRYEHQLVVADGDYVMLHGRFSQIGQPANWVVADIVRVADGMQAELDDTQAADVAVVRDRKVAQALGFPADLAEEICARIEAATSPAVIVGGDVERYGAWDAVIGLAETTQSVVWAAPMTGVESIPRESPVASGDAATRCGLHLPSVNGESGVLSPLSASSTGADMSAADHDWTKPAALAIPEEGYFQEERGRYGPIYPRTPACYGFSIIAKVKEGREEAVRAYGKQIQTAIATSPDVLAPLRLHYLRWVLFDVGSGLHFQYQGIFDTDFDKYTEDAVALFSQTDITTVFTNLEGFPDDWKENPAAFVKFVRDHQYPSFLEYGEYPYVTADEIKKALRLKSAFSDMLDQMQ